MINIKKRQNGFTLIELLVVMSIISILSSITMTSLISAKYRANDAKRKSHFVSMRSALELYYSNHGSYPSTSGAWYGASGPVTVTPDWIPGLTAENDLRVLPQDPYYPSNNGQSNCTNWPGEYLYRSNDGKGYVILAHCAANSAMSAGSTRDAFYDPIRPTWAWKMCSFGSPECGL